MTISKEEEAKNKVLESIRTLLTLKVTMPLGNPNLKLLHTNQFLYLDLPSEFSLANMEALDNALNSSFSRYSGYHSNRWYIEGITINNTSGGDAKIELDLNPYASSMLDYQNAYEGFIDAYTQAENSNSNNNTSSGKVSSVKTDNSTFKGGEGKTIDNLVKNIIGDETDNMKKAKLIHEYLRKNSHYSGYPNSRTKTPTQAYNKWRKSGINCADTSRLTASMMRSAGIDCYVVHSFYHYYTVFKYKNKLHCSDATSKKRYLDQFWQGTSKNPVRGYTRKFTGKNCYNKKCGDNPCS